MKNPLNKRLPKEFFSELGKYLVIFLFMTGTIGFISGFLVADGSMIKAYDDSFEKYNIEDGQFELYKELNNKEIKKLESYSNIKLYENYYIEKNYTDNDKIERTLRIYKNREDINKADLMEGDFPKAKDEIAIDRMYAANNNINIGDEIVIEDKSLKVTGFVALSDYSSLFSNNNDIMFDALLFGVALMSEEGYESFEAANEHYIYSWDYSDNVSDEDEIKYAGRVLVELYKLTTETGNTISNFVPSFENQAIQFAGNDIGGDKSMMMVLLYILIIIMAFVFAVTTENTISKEAAVIGTLRASGYTRGELIRHYMALPVIVTLISSVLGNILGYTIFKKLCVDMYYNSYSLPTYVTVWSGEAFILTTIIPLIIMLIINAFIISSKLKLSPLKFLRNNLSKSKRSKAVKLPHFKFLTRFRLRVIIQNRSSYITLFMGIVFANILLMFGLMLNPLLDNFSKESVKHMICDYQYVLKDKVETDNQGAEKYALSSLSINTKLYGTEDIMVYGIKENSKYIDISIEDGKVYISNTMADKYSLKNGDKFTLKGSYDNVEYEFEVDGIYNYPASVAIFMNIDDFNEKFNYSEDNFSGYFSNEEIIDIEEGCIASIITEEDLTKVSRQLDTSLGGMMGMVRIFALILFALLIYLLTKLIIEKNSNSISMIKILGYEDSEINKIYLVATSIVVIISSLLSLVIDTYIIKILYRLIMSKLSGWIIFHLEPSIFVEMFIYGIVLYLFVLILQIKKIKKIPMTDALKNVE